MLRRLKNLLFTAISAVLLTLPYHFPSLGFTAFFAFIPFFFVLDSKASAFKYSYVFGFLFFSLSGYWLTNVNVLGYVLLAMYLAIYFVFFSLFAAKFIDPPADFNKTNMAFLVKASFYLPAFWVAMEMLRAWAIGGLPWALLGYSQWKNIVFIQIADITSVYGVSFFVMAVNIILFQIFRIVLMKNDQLAFRGVSPDRRRKIAVLLAEVLLGLFFVVCGYGIWTLKSWEAFYSSPAQKAMIRISVLQGNIPQDEKWDAKIKNIIFEKYKRLTLMSAIEKSDLIVWPETSFPGYLEDEAAMAAQLRNVVRESKTNVLVGAPTFGDLEKGLRFYNSAVLYGADGEEKKRYSKLHLVPFGEYVPFEPFTSFIRNFVQIGHFTAGTEKTIFTINTRYQDPNIKAKFATLICYEDIFPGLVRDFCKGGADFLINMTNDAWFGKTSAPYQHAEASVFRAVENRVNVVRATNTGFSCFISPEGKVLGSVKENGEEIFVTGHKACELILRKGRSFYTRFGDVFAFFCILLCFVAYKDLSKHRTYARL